MKSENYKLKMTSSKILFFLSISFISGIFIESTIKIPQFLLWIFLFLNFLGIIIFSLFKKDVFIIIGFCILFLIIGITRVQISEFNITNDKISKFNDRGEVFLEGIISDEPDVRDTFQKIKVRPVKFAFSDASLGDNQFDWIKIEESTVLITTKKYPEYRYLDKIEIIGNLETPMITDSFNYKNYLLKDHIYSVMNFPKIKLLSEKPKYNIFSYLYEKILYFKQKIRESIQHNFLPPQSSILEGTILGDNGAMSNDFKNKLNITGLRHVIAVSGTHIVILSSIIMSLLLFLGFWRSQAFYFAITFILIFVVFTGLPASGVRAGIMGGIYLLAQKIGRQSTSSRIIIIACAIMLMINPLLLFYDVGFQLSFLAVMGLIYLEPFIKILIIKTILVSKFKIINKIGKKLMKEKHTKELISIISATFAAQIFTLPIMVYNFGNISFVSPITNLLIIPVVWWLMIFGFLASIAGVFSNIFGFILSIPCWFLLTYFVKIIDLFSKPWMSKNITNVSWIWVLASYFAIGFIIWLLNKKYKDYFIEDYY